jgi:hypothetical protein
VAIATRYLSYPHIIWHIMFDDTQTPAVTRGIRIKNLFDGINDTEGPTKRPVRWLEPNQGSSTFDQGWVGDVDVFPINCLYNYNGNSTEISETAYAQVSGPIGDCEPLYVAHPYSVGNSPQQLRERNYALFIEGGSLINFGHEDWWPFGASGIFTAGLTWPQVLDGSSSVEMVQTSYCWTFIDTYLKNSGYGPVSTFVTTGEGSGETKAAQGASGTVAVAYFPDNRTVAVDTTIIAGTGNVRLRWFDPVLGTYSTIAASEAQQTGRSVTLPSARGDGTRDFVLVVD